MATNSGDAQPMDASSNGRSFFDPKRYIRMDDLDLAEQAALDRVFAGLREVAIARFNLQVVATEVAGVFENFAATWEAGDFALKLDEAEAVATHPDLVELNVQMDGFYGEH